ncbi:MAG: hypothetical protein ABL902_09660 [Gallionella sp.]|nr:hypothetical protein [Gallionella sp.]
MLKLKECFFGCLAVALVSLSVIGCVQSGSIPEGYESDDDCMFCHSKTNAKQGRDLSDMYINVSEHHPIEIVYPPLPTLNDFNLPNARKGDKSYFDTNENGKLDNEEIRLFVDEGKVEITCNTCHREHAKGVVQMENPDEDFLRGNTREFCHVCHRKEVRPIAHH